jgi:hypothetical protein
LIIRPKIKLQRGEIKLHASKTLEKSQKLILGRKCPLLKTTPEQNHNLSYFNWNGIIKSLSVLVTFYCIYFLR